MSDAVYGTYTKAELDEQYDTSVPVGGNVAPYLQRMERESASARSSLAMETDLRYGDHERDVIDYVPAASGAPLFVWIHGGYWWRLSKDFNRFVATVPAHAGAAVALVNYPLAPEVSLDRIVASVRAAHAFALARASASGAPPSRVVVGGHSAGAQLAAAVAAVCAVDGLFTLSGLYDLEPLRHTKVNDNVAMDEATAVRNGPVHLPPVRASQLVTSVGEREQPEFHRQQQMYAAAWRAWGGDVTEIPAPGDDHFSIVLRLVDERDPLTESLLQVLTLANSRPAHTPTR